MVKRDVRHSVDDSSDVDDGLSCPRAPKHLIGLVVLVNAAHSPDAP